MADKKSKSRRTKDRTPAAGKEDATANAPFGAPEATDPILIQADLTPAPAAGPLIMEPRKPVTTASPQLAVAGMTQAGTYVFELVVVDDLGVVSQPVSFSVQVTQP